MRIIVHTGKGGVGKTSVSAATALRCAERGYKTIVISTDTAHSLGDSFDAEIGPEPTPLAPNLWGQEVDARYSMEKYWGSFQEYMISIFTQRGVEEIVAEEVTILPGLEEGAHLLWINKYMEEGEYDVLIIDAAPTAETLRLLSLPDVTRWWFEKVIAATTGVAGAILRPFAKRISGADLPDSDAMDKVRNLFDTLDEVRDVLANSEISATRLVLNAERMVIKETQRTYTYLNLYGYPTDAVICNRLIPETVTDPYFNQWKVLQSENLDLIGEAFGDLPVLKAYLQDDEVGGMESLRAFAETLYGDGDPTELMYRGKTHTFESDGEGGFHLIVPLPFAEKGDIDLYRAAQELTLRVGPYRRNVVLPYALWDLEIDYARFEENALRIHFIAGENG